MRAGAHAEALPAALSGCDQAYVMIYPELAWDERIKAQLAQQCIVLDSVDNLLVRLKTDLKANDQVVFMSNGSFDDAPRRLLELLEE